MEIKTGCWKCKHLDFIADIRNVKKDIYEILDGVWVCNNNENFENFKVFPCKRKLKCFEEIKK